MAPLKVGRETGSIREIVLLGVDLPSARPSVAQVEY